MQQAHVPQRLSLTHPPSFAPQAGVRAHLTGSMRPSLLRVPSGKMWTHSPASRRAWRGGRGGGGRRTSVPAHAPLLPPSLLHQTNHRALSPLPRPLPGPSLTLATRMPGCAMPAPLSTGSTVAALKKGASEACLKQRSVAHSVQRSAWGRRRYSGGRTAQGAWVGWWTGVGEG